MKKQVSESSSEVEKKTKGMRFLRIFISEITQIYELEIKKLRDSLEHKDDHLKEQVDQVTVPLSLSPFLSRRKTHLSARNSVVSRAISNNLEPTIFPPRHTPKLPPPKSSNGSNRSASTSSRSSRSSRSTPPSPLPPPQIPPSFTSFSTVSSPRLPPSNRASPARSRKPPAPRAPSLRSRPRCSAPSKAWAFHWTGRKRAKPG